MIKRTLTSLAVATVITGCASSKPVSNHYSYESQIHSGTVHVTDTSYGDSKKCPAKWREAEQVYKTGLPPMVGMTLKVKVTVFENGIEKELPILVSAGNGPQISLKDYQSDKALLIGSETNGLVKQGELFEYPEGYFLRAAKPEAIRDDFSLCLGVDRMYVDQASMASGTPSLKLDRLNVLFKGESGEVKTYQFGDKNLVKVQVTTVTQ